MVTELYNSVYDYFKEKLVSPVSGVFLFVWCVFNWKPILITFMDSRPIIERLAFITENYSTDWQVFWGPVFITVLYVVIYPFVVLGAFSVSEFADLLKRKLRFFLDEGRPFDPEEKKALLKSEREASEKADNYYQQLLSVRGQYLDFVLKTQESVEQLQSSTRSEETDQRLEDLSQQLRDARFQIDEITSRNDKKGLDLAKIGEDRSTLDYQIFRHAFENLADEQGAELLEWVVNHTGSRYDQKMDQDDLHMLDWARLEGLITLDDDSIGLTKKGQAILGHYLGEKVTA